MHSIVQIREWPGAAIEGSLVESELEGFRFVRRAAEEWLSGANSFSKDGEAFFAVFESARLVAIGGINRGSEGDGRLRRVYVRREDRKRGLGRRLIEHLLTFAKPRYLRVGLRCDTDAADRFYRAVGFRRTEADPGMTHIIELETWPLQSDRDRLAKLAATPSDR